MENKISSKKIYPIFVSLVLVVKNKADNHKKILTSIIKKISNIVSDFEIIIIDNASNDGTFDILKKLTKVDGLPNLQVFSLADEVDDHIARWIGLENSLGDYIISIDNLDLFKENIEEIIKQLVKGHEIVLTRTSSQKRQKKLHSLYVYRFLVKSAQTITGLDLNYYTTSFFGISRRVANYIQQFDQPDIRLKNISVITSFRKFIINLNSANKTKLYKRSILRWIKYIISSTNSPLRIVTLLSAFGSLLSIFYSIYIVIIWIIKRDIAPGWVSLSMQQSVMFLLISLVLLVISEYIIEISRKSISGPKYFIIDEAFSANNPKKDIPNLISNSQFFMKQNNIKYSDYE